MEYTPAPAPQVRIALRLGAYGLQQKLLGKSHAHFSMSLLSSNLSDLQYESVKRVSVREYVYCCVVQTLSEILAIVLINFASLLEP